jgi:hypothetical protein
MQKTEAVKRVRELEKENARLKIITEQAVDITILKE